MNEERITGAAKDFAGKTERTIGDATGNAETQIGGRVREAAGKAQNIYGQAKDAARDAADAATGYAKDIYNNQGEAIRDGSEALTKTVRDNPIGSLVTAGAIGFALAMLLARPARRRSPRWRDYA
jgi:uncharacterized protein YjbJ (UPF0337 family)